MKSKRVAIINLIIAVVLCVFTLGHAFAWLAEERKTFDQKFNGSSAQAYFAGGSGTMQDPYEINDKYHLYNLAWLQNTGKLARSDGGKYYFELTSSVNMSTDFWLPPIGTEEHPFSSDFNGNGYTVKNLRITTDSSKLSGVVNGNTVAFSNAVGMFGKTEEGSEIHNFILQAPVVEVANANATYQGGANRVAGLAVGHVAVDSKVYSIGVLADSLSAELLVNRAGYSTFNSIIGELAVGADSSVTGGGHVAGEGSGSSFGSSFDVYSMLDRLDKINDNNGESPYLPEIDTSSSNPIVAKGDMMPFTVTSASTYTGATAREVTAKTNVGYFLGNQNKISTTKELQFTEPLTQPANQSTDWYAMVDGEAMSPHDSGRVPKWVYKFNGGYGLSSDVYTSQMGFEPLSQEEFDELPDGIKNIFPEDNDTKVRFTGVKLSQALWVNEGQTVSPTMTTSSNNSAWSFHGQIVWNGKTYGEGFRDHEGYVVDENWERISYVNQWGATDYYTFNGYDKGVILPNCTVWFKPASAGKIKFLMFSDGGLEGFALLKIVRNSATPSEPFKVNAVLGENWSWTTDIELSQVMRVRLPENVLFYYEHEVTAEDVANCNVEYMLVSENGGAYFVYMDIGASADEDSYTIDRNKAVSAVDFIYDGVSIAQTDDTAETPAYSSGDFIIQASGVLYEATGTSVYFEQLNTVLKIVYMRKSVSEEQTLSVAITGTSDNSLVLATKAEKVEFTFSAT